MYDNIGGKIKGLARATFIVGAIGSIITAIALPATSGDPDDFILISLPIAVGGSFASWISSLVLYGFGELIDKATDIERNTRGGVKASPETRVNSSPETRANSSSEAEEKARIENVLRRNGVNPSSSTTKRCPYCGEIVKSNKCEMCGKEINY